MVASNIKETRRLRRLKVASLDTGELAWMDCIIEETKDALKNIAGVLERVRVDKELKGELESVNKIAWVIKDHPKIGELHARLAICHQSLMGVITCLHAKGAVLVSRVPEEHAPLHDPQMEKFLSWQTQRKRRKSVASTESLRSSSTLSTTSSRSSASTRINDPTGPCMISLPELDESTFDGFNPFDGLHSDMAASNWPELEARDCCLRSGGLSTDSMSSAPESDWDSCTLEPNDYFSHNQPASETSLALAPTLYQDLEATSFSFGIESPPLGSTAIPDSRLEDADGLQVYDTYALYRTHQILDQQVQNPVIAPSHTMQWLSPAYFTASLSHSTGARNDSGLDHIKTSDDTQYSKLALGSPLQPLGKHPELGKAYSDGYLPTTNHHCLVANDASTMALPERPGLSSSGRRTVSSGRRNWMAYNASRHYDEYKS